MGVVVFDARTGALDSFNREMRRIVEGLRSRDQLPEQLLGIITICRADGWEVSLASLSMPEVLSTGEMLQAEQAPLMLGYVALSVLGGFAFFYLGLLLARP